MSKKHAILDSAEDLIRREGSTKLTLERVAEHAKVSKGGLLYHFPSKEQLIVGVVSRTLEYFERDWKKARERLPDTPGRNALAFLEASLEGPWKTDASAHANPLDMLASTTAAFATDPKLVVPVREAYQRWQVMLESDGLDPTTVTIVRLAVEGIWYTEVFGFDEFSGKRREQMIKGLQKMCLSAVTSDGQPQTRERKKHS